jgi:hypothetical protein
VDYYPEAHITMDDKITGKGEAYGPDSHENTRVPSPAAPTYEKSSELSPQTTFETSEVQKRTLWQRIKEPGSVWQIIIAALAGIALGLIVTSTVDEIPEACIALLAVPGQLWLRALQAVGMFTCVPFLDDFRTH